MQRLGKNSAMVKSGDGYDARAMDVEKSPYAECIIQAQSRDDHDLALSMYRKNLFLVVRGACSPVRNGNSSANTSKEEEKPKKKKAKLVGTDQQPPSMMNTMWGYDDIKMIYSQDKVSIEETFCVESEGVKLPVAHFLASNKNQRPPPAQWYASFILQKNKDVFRRVISELPLDAPAFLRQPVATQSEALWFFFGQNTGSDGNV
jgi:hypothetical protein